MLYRTEFPDYDKTLIIPKGFEDGSYHNDICPRVIKTIIVNKDEVVYNIWQDYKDKEKREYGEYENSTEFLFDIQVNGNVVFYYRTDDWTEIEKLIQNANVC